MMSPFESRLRAHARQAGMAGFMSAPLHECVRALMGKRKLDTFLKAFPEYRERVYELLSR